MFGQLKKVLLMEGTDPAPGNTGNQNKRIKMATAALFIEIAKADGNFSEDERKRIIDIMKSGYNLDEEYIEELMALSEEKVNESISIYEFASIINENFNNNEKTELMTNLWRVIYQDGRLDMNEDRLIKIIGATLNLDHKEIINSKLLAKHETDQNKE